jgi:uncharacterized protein YdhG (YjbR/CyaY superfamily)
MAKSNFKSVDDYMAAKPPAARRVLQRVRRTIKKALPGAQEVISYQIPAYKLNGRVIVYFAGWSEHFSLYPAIGRVQAAFKDDLRHYEVSKGTIRFPLSGRVPLKLIERLAKFRAKEIAGEDTAYRSTKRKRS